MDDYALSWLRSDISIRDCVRRLTRLFEARGFWGASQDARALVGHATGLDFSGLVIRGDELVAKDARAAIVGLAARRLSHEPVGRILGSRDFMGLDLEVTAATLEPREDTEILVECGLEYLRSAGIARPVVADLGTGTGAILIAILARYPSAIGVAVDISREALATATRNALRHGVSARWHGVVGDFGAALAPTSCDLIVSNPPYIASAEIAGLDPDVRDYDPLLALDGGTDGLAAYRTLLPQARFALRAGCPLMVEIGSSQAAAVGDLMTIATLSKVRTVLDRAARDRVVIGDCPDRFSDTSPRLAKVI